MKHEVYYILIFVLIFSCEETNFEPVYDVPEELEYIVKNFELEAKSRGHNIIIDNLIITYDSNLGPLVCGSCNANSTKHDEQKIISVNADADCWNYDEELEVLIFHELGHCYLGRIHDNRRLPNGDPRSIMVKEGLDLYNPCIYPIGYEICGEAYKRLYYVDELFDEQTEIPDWAN